MGMTKPPAATAAQDYFARSEKSQSIIAAKKKQPRFHPLTYTHRSFPCSSVGTPTGRSGVHRWTYQCQGYYKKRKVKKPKTDQAGLSKSPEVTGRWSVRGSIPTLERGNDPRARLAGWAWPTTRSAFCSTRAWLAG
jgi:hypothetical protein